MTAACILCIAAMLFAWTDILRIVLCRLETAGETRQVLPCFGHDASSARRECLFQ
jgi:hypothetical protein